MEWSRPSHVRDNCFRSGRYGNAAKKTFDTELYYILIPSTNYFASSLDSDNDLSFLQLSGKLKLFRKR